MKLDKTLLEKQANTLRFLSADMVQRANSGHPGAPLGLADIMAVLSVHLRHNPKNPNWLNRDRFVLSGGHASALLYSFLHLSGYDLSLEDLKNFRQLHSKTPGHPEISTPGVEIATGPLGQGVANAVGFAMAAKKAAQMLGENLINHKIYCLCGDGDLEEGLSYEACSLAGLHALKNLILIYDSNAISIEGAVNLAFDEDVKMRFEAQGFFVQSIDGHDFDAINNALEEAKMSAKPSLIIAKTKIAKGAGRLEGSEHAHGAPLGEEIIKQMKASAGFEPEKHFQVPEDAKFIFEAALEIGDLAEAKWNAELEKSGKKELVNSLLSPDFSTLTLPDLRGKDMATRDSNSELINAISAQFQGFLGGSADLAPSNKTELKGAGDFAQGKNIHFGIREHAMAAINNAFARYGLFTPFSATFFVFSEYLKPAARLSALMSLRHFYIFTHDSIGVGEDGPTHQPIEQLSTFRAMPNFYTFRPADGNENAILWDFALKNLNAPCAFVLSRQKLKALNEAVFGSATQGAYLLKEASAPKFTLLSSGSEVSLCLEVASELEKKGFGVNVISMPCFELFEKQSKDYQNRLLKGVVIGVEAASSKELFKFCDKLYNIETFGESGKESDVFAHFGFTPEKLVNFILADEL